MQQRTRPSHQDGQVMVLTAFMVLVMLTGILVGYDLARLVLARIKFQNGADAAVLAAVAVKLEKHHFETTWRWAMQQEAYLSRMEIMRAKLKFAQTALNVQGNKPGFGVPTLPIPPGGIPGVPPVGVPGKPPVGVPGAAPGGPVSQAMLDAREEFRQRANKAYRHAAKLHQLDKTLLTLYQEMPALFREATIEAADIAWRMNIGGFESHSGPDGRNDGLMRGQTALFETATSSGTPGGIAYRNEGSFANATFGKSAVEINAGMQPISGAVSFIRVLPSYQVRVNAGAQPLAVIGSGKIEKNSDRYIADHATSLAKGGVVPGFDPEMQWHQPALVALRGENGGRRAPYH